VTIFFEKDRSGILAGKSIQWPNYSTIEPIVKHLSGDHQPSLGTTDATAEKDAAVIESQKAAADAERQTLYETIRTAINNSRTIDELKAAIGLTKGKKTKLGEELFSLLETQKDTRKVELLRAEVA
jgi:hypothetical protein